jgi:hypothetical protein
MKTMEHVMNALARITHKAQQLPLGTFPQDETAWIDMDYFHFASSH